MATFPEHGVYANNIHHTAYYNYQWLHQQQWDDSYAAWCTRTGQAYGLLGWEVQTLSFSIQEVSK